MFPASPRLLREGQEHPLVSRRPLCMYAANHFWNFISPDHPDRAPALGERGFFSLSPVRIYYHIHIYQSSHPFISSSPAHQCAGPVVGEHPQ